VGIYLIVTLVGEYCSRMQSCLTPVLTVNDTDKPALINTSSAGVLIEALNDVYDLLRNAIVYRFSASLFFPPHQTTF